MFLFVFILAPYGFEHILPIDLQFIVDDSDRASFDSYYMKDGIGCTL